MKATLAIMLLFAAPLQAQKQMTGREYYQELKAANTFIHVKDVYACFRDDDSPSFAVVARGGDVIANMKDMGLPLSKDVLAGKNTLVVETYYKGVSNGVEIFDAVGKGGADY